jgi:Cu/Ag efflux pump CusA
MTMQEINSNEILILLEITVAIGQSLELFFLKRQQHKLKSIETKLPFSVCVADNIVNEMRLRKELKAMNLISILSIIKGIGAVIEQALSMVENFNVRPEEKEQAVNEIAKYKEKLNVVQKNIEVDS